MDLIQRKELRNHLELVANSIEERLKVELKDYETRLHFIDSNIYKVTLSQENKKFFVVKIIQILRIVKIFIYDYRRETSCSLILSIDKFFKPMLRNSIIIDERRKLQDCQRATFDAAKVTDYEG